MPVRQHIIFEGAELSGKSFLMSQVYNWLEPKYNSGGRILDGCHWFNCDVGLFGTALGKATLEKYTDLLEAIAGDNFMLEKFHLSEAVYQKMYNNISWDFSMAEKRLQKINTKLIIVTFDEDEELIKHRLEDRLRLYPHYQRIARPPADYIRQQRLYLDTLKVSRLQHLVVNASVLPNDEVVEDILRFLGEK